MCFMFYTWRRAVRHLSCYPMWKRDGAGPRAHPCAPSRHLQALMQPSTAGLRVEPRDVLQRWGRTCSTRSHACARRPSSASTLRHPSAPRGDAKRREYPDNVSPGRRRRSVVMPSLKQTTASLPLASTFLMSPFCSLAPNAKEKNPYSGLMLRRMIYKLAVAQ